MQKFILSRKPAVGLHSLPHCFKSAVVSHITEKYWRSLHVPGHTYLPAFMINCNLNIHIISLPLLWVLI
uniref:Uncharacterized protein n=1 Tax=Rhizophora mucronata TaxID=61149 RepID=A0A2P2IML5_RHIMU